MAMTSCRECGQSVSTSAKTCPSCGIAYPGRSALNRPLGCSGCLLILVGVVVAVLVFGLSPTPSGRGGGASTPSVVVSTTPFHNTGAVNVREGPGTGFRIVNVLSANQTVPLGAADTSGWAPIVDPTGQVRGYVLTSLLTEGEAPPTPARAQRQEYGRLVVCDAGVPLGSVNLWDSPQRQRATARVPTGTSCQGPQVEILAQQPGRCSGECLRIRVVESGATGWISEIFVEKQ